MKQRIITILAMTLAILYSIGLLITAWSAPNPQPEAFTEPELAYEQTLFSSDAVQIIDIQVSESDWESLKQDALAKECIDSTITINGDEMHHIGLRTKGNSTLLFSAARGRDKMSFVLEFDAFDETRRFQGLDCLALYNNMFDASCMKTFLSYEMMRSMGVPTPLCSFAAVYLNGEYLGIYAATEMLSESFALRNFGYDYGNLYKPEQFDLAAILKGELQNCKIDLEAALNSDSGFSIDSFLSISNDSVRLAYLGESLYDYEDIWRNSTFPIGTSDKRRLVNALEAINSGDVSAIDLDMVARYFAVNTFVLNTDCYTTGMAHNYGLYEKDGILTMLPWDYDVALGNIGSEFGISDPTVFINHSIDTPILGTTLEERPMLNVLLQNPEGNALYRQYLQELVDLWIHSGRLEQTVEQLSDMLRPWIAEDTHNLYAMDEVEQAFVSISQFCALRGESIQGQLDGTVDVNERGTLIDCSGYSPPNCGMMKVLVPEYDGVDVSFGAILQVLPEINRNLHNSVNLVALLNLVDVGQLMELDLSAMSSGDHSDVDKALLLDAMVPYIPNLLWLLISWISVPVLLIFGFRFVKRYGKKKGGVSRVV